MEDGRERRSSRKMSALLATTGLGMLIFGRRLF